MKIANIIEHYVLSALHNFLTLGGSHIAYGVEWEIATQVCVPSRLHPQRLPALYYVFLELLREEGKINMVSSSQLEKLKLREVKSNHSDKLVKSLNVLFSAVSSSLLLSYDLAVVSSFPCTFQASPVLLGLMPSSLKRRTFPYPGTG